MPCLSPAFYIGATEIGRQNVNAYFTERATNCKAQNTPYKKSPTNGHKLGGVETQNPVDILRCLNQGSYIW
jgi:hypothetical protein